jgi:hypothetical protein
LGAILNGREARKSDLKRCKKGSGNFGGAGCLYGSLPYLVGKMGYAVLGRYRRTVTPPPNFGRMLLAMEKWLILAPTLSGELYDMGKVEISV